MEFRSYSDMAAVIARHVGAKMLDCDIVVGVPRSGMVPAGMIALLLNKPLADLDGFLEGRTLGHGLTRSPMISDPKHRRPRVLVVEDSVSSGRSIRAVRKRVAEHRPDVVAWYLAVFVEPKMISEVDFALEPCPCPRVFEWNLLHADPAQWIAFDLDGVLCADPTPEENDDGERYLRFLADAEPLAIPSVPIRSIVTSRLEKYRPQSEAWLRKWNIRYSKLIMLDVPTAEERRRRNLHAAFKAEQYRRDGDCRLFVESDAGQALAIARTAGKPVLDFSTKRVCLPNALSVACQTERTRSTMVRIGRGLTRRAKALLSA